MTKFTGKKPLSKGLSTQIEAHFNYFWQHDRLALINEQKETLAELPKKLKKRLMT